MFKMEIGTGGSAFCDPNTGEEDVFCEAVELARILREVADDLENYSWTKGVIMDVNGNNVGKWSR